jgi:hypothetical protein
VISREVSFVNMGLTKGRSYNISKRRTLIGGTMYCPTCGNEITVELNYCNRCGANLALPPSSQPVVATVPVSLTVPTIVIGLTITIGLGIIFGGVTGLAERQVHPAAITWIILFSMATLFGCSALLIRFWSKMVGLQRQISAPQQPNIRPAFERATPATATTF